jgi:hypothetical protein
MFELLSGLAEVEDRQASDVIDVLRQAQGANGTAQDRTGDVEATRQ